MFFNIGIHLWAMHSATAIYAMHSATKFHGGKLVTMTIMDLAALERRWLGLMTGPSDFVLCHYLPAPGFRRFLSHIHFLQSDVITQSPSRWFPEMTVGRDWYLHGQRCQGYHVNWRLNDRDSGKCSVRNDNGSAKRLRYLCISPSIPDWATSSCNKLFWAGSGCQQRIWKKNYFDIPPPSALCAPCQAPLPRGLPPFSWFLGTALPGLMIATIAVCFCRCGTGHKLANRHRSTRILITRVKCYVYRVVDCDHLIM